MIGYVPLFTPKRIPASDIEFPTSLKPALCESTPEFIDLIGREVLLSSRALALLCSSKCPDHAILAAYDLASKWSSEGKCVISGFQSPVEKECLRVLLRNSAPIVVCPARSLHGLRIPAAWKKPIEEGRLLLVSTFKDYEDRNRINLAQQRNEIVAALASEVFVVHASPDGKLEALCRKLVKGGKPTFTFDHQENAQIIALGVRPSV